MGDELVWGHVYCPLGVVYVSIGSKLALLWPTAACLSGLECMHGCQDDHCDPTQLVFFRMPKVESSHSKHEIHHSDYS